MGQQAGWMPTRDLAVVLALSACVPAMAEPPPGTDFIEVYGGSGFAGFNRTAIYADDTVIATVAGPGGQNQTVKRGQAPAGAYLRAAAVVAAKGPRVAARLKASDDGVPCMDYGTDAVRADPPIGRLAEISARCPDEGLGALMSDVRRAIAMP